MAFRCMGESLTVGSVASLSLPDARDDLAQ